MILSETHRSAVYENLSPLVGEDPMNAILSHFPRNEGEAPATKDLVEQQITLAKSELREQFAKDIGKAVNTLWAEIVHLHRWMMVAMASLAVSLVVVVALG